VRQLLHEQLPVVVARRAVGAAPAALERVERGRVLAPLGVAARAAHALLEVPDLLRARVEALAPAADEGGHDAGGDEEAWGGARSEAGGGRAGCRRRRKREIRGGFAVQWRLR
jgi:hypothetical protein